MADYYPLIAKAIEGLSDKSPAIRRAVYDRARNALVAQLQRLEPPIAPADIERERAALDLAIGAVEAQYVLPTPQTPIDDEPTRTLLEPLEQESQQEQDEEVPLPPVASDDVPFDNPDSEPAYEPLPDQPEDISGRIERPKIGSKRPVSGQANRIRAIVLVASVFAVVVAIAGLAIYNRVDPAKDAPVVEQTTEPVDTPSETGKFADRLGGGVAPSTSPAEGNSSNTTTTVAVQEAVLFEEDPDNPSMPKANAGHVQWHLDVMDASPGKPLETVVRADVDYAEIGFKLHMLIRHNTDSSFPASHIIELTFSQKEGDADRVVRDSGVILMKDEVTEQGVQLTGLPAPVQENVFLVGLSDMAVDVERNKDLLMSKGWFDIPVRFANGCRAIISFEKGPSGYQTISEAFRVW